MRIRVAQVKVLPDKGNLEANSAKLMVTLDAVKGEKPDVVVTPECFLDGYVATEEAVTADEMARYALDPASSPLVDAVADWARSHAAWVILGCTRRATDGVYNSALVLDRRGVLLGVYDKTHCQAQDRKFRPGRTLAPFDSDFGLFGVMICADRRWPETVRTLALQGARIIFNPTYGMHDEKNFWLMRTRSYESEVFIAFTHPLQALLTGPTGDVISNETRAEIPLTVAEVDLAEADKTRARPSAHLRDRRPELYVR